MQKEAEVEDVDAWVAQARQGDEEAFGRLVMLYQDRLHALMVRMVRNGEDAKELCQQTWVKVWTKLDTFKGEAAFYSWVYRIGSFTALDFLRKKKRKGEVTYLDEWTPDEAPEESRVNQPAVQPDQAAARSEVMDTFRKALDQLSDVHRMALVLRELEGLSYEEIADAMECKKGTVMSRIFNARKQIQQYMEDLR